MTSLTFRILHTFRTTAARDLLARRHGQQPRYVKDSLALLSMIVIIFKSSYFNMIALANRFVRQRLERESRFVLSVIPGRNNRLPKIHWTRQ